MRFLIIILVLLLLIIGSLGFYLGGEETVSQTEIEVEKPNIEGSDK